MFINELKKVLLVATCGVIIADNCFGTGSVKIKPTENSSSKELEYTCLKSIDEVRGFISALGKAEEKQIFVGSQDSKCKISDAVKLVLGNTVKHLDPSFSGDLDSFTGESLNEYRQAYLVAVLWVMQYLLFSNSVDPAIYCLNLLHKIAQNSYEKSRLLLLSQCTDDQFIPIDGADWSIIGDAIVMLRNEKNGKAVEANTLLERLKNNGNFPEWL